MSSYTATTFDIQVEVEPEFLNERSSPTENHYVWAYHVRIENQSERRVQLRSRYWRITDANGHVQEVRGPGVVGEEPWLEPGSSFEYSSGAPLTTPSGIMTGSYSMEDESGDQFDIDVPAFSLDSPHQAVRLN
ncbi:MAG: Co2+/Mg2+ efflux protein ApaG [Alphaproteobacteria bacterium]|nr:Co2+/Mg2+ efflux protein ApaG [Alphaproteobacteria bacterium SS10]